MTNKIHDAFDKIEASEELKFSTLQFLRTEREKQSSRKSYLSARTKILAAACSMLVLLTVICGSYYTVQTPVSYISIDVNPSVELALNQYDRVVSATAYNEDGAIVLEGVNIRGKLYTDAIDAIVSSDAMKPYLSADTSLTFTVAALDSSKESTILTGIKNCSGCQKHGGQGYTADVASVSQAHENGLSFGKYAAYLVLSQYDSTVTAEDCQNMSMSEIQNKIRECETVGEHSGNPDGNGASNCSDAENGNGYGYGHGHGHGNN